MITPPKSKVAIMLFVIATFFACGFAVAIYQFVRMPGDTREGTVTKINVLEVARYSGIAALMTFVLGYVVQMIAEIRWKLFEGQTNA